MNILTLKDDLSRTTNYNKYSEKPSIRKPVDWHPEHELFWLSEKILEWFYNDELGIVIIHGQQGYGKSTYATISCAEVYGHDINNSRFCYNWEAVKKHIVWHPEHFIKISKKIPDRRNPLYKVHPQSRKKEPMLLWDDAGYFLNSMKWNDKFCIEVGRYLEVARPRWGAIIFTCSHQQQILSKIRNIPHSWSIPIKKRATPKRGQPKYKWSSDNRMARLHKSWCSEDMKKSGKKGKECDFFKARMPGRYDPVYPDSLDDEGNIVYIDNITNKYTLSPKDAKLKGNKRVSYGFYSWYKPFREMFEEKGLEAVEISAKEIGL